MMALLQNNVISNKKMNKIDISCLTYEPCYRFVPKTNENNILEDQLTDDFETICKDFGKFPEFGKDLDLDADIIHADQYGIFYSPHLHKVILNNQYDYTVTCDENSCDFYGTSYCKYLKSVECYKDCFYPRESLECIIKSLIANGFKYVPIYDNEGKCIYFDENGYATI